jgi:hypothetical protein
VSRKSKIVFTTLSSLIFVLVIINIVLGLGNQSIQSEVSERQQIIAQTLQLETLNRQVIGVLANMAIKTNDEQLKKVLAESGINLEPKQPAAPAKK